MKPVLSIALLLVANLVLAQPNVIDINKRVNLPVAVYDSLKSYRAILCGEMHGTNESPQFMEGLVKLWIQSGEKVILALEINESEQHFVDSFLATGDFSIIQRMPHFNKKLKDGKSSVGMASLIRNLYGQKNLKIIFFDPVATKYPPEEKKVADNSMDYSRGQIRDSLMATNIINAANNNPGYKIILLAGNVHSGIAIREMHGIGYRPMGYFISQNTTFRKSTVALNILYQSGKAWNGTAEGFGEHELYENNSPYTSYSNAANFLYLEPVLDDIGYNGILFSRYVTSSKPLNE